MKSLHHKPSRFRRSVSLILTLVMMLSLAAGNLSSSSVQAAETEPHDLTVHYNNPDGWSEVYGYSWTGDTKWLGD